uniref:F-box domain-containing protein n=1 Tax=Macrostomum lignano TaxID=282301 RepID=A0A1I8JQ66_9PLAT
MAQDDFVGSYWPCHFFQQKHMEPALDSPAAVNGCRPTDCIVPVHSTYVGCFGAQSGPRPLRSRSTDEPSGPTMTWKGIIVTFNTPQLELKCSQHPILTYFCSFKGCTKMALPLQPGSHSPSQLKKNSGLMQGQMAAAADCCPSSGCPPSLLERVLTELDQTSLGRCAQVSRLWHQVVMQPLLWTKIHIDESNWEVRSKNLVDEIVKLPQLLFASANLTCLSLDHVEVCLVKCPNLRELRLIRCGMSLTTKSLNSLLAGCPSLSLLQIECKRLQYAVDLDCAPLLTKLVQRLSSLKVILISLARNLMSIICGPFFLAMLQSFRSSQPLYPKLLSSPLDKDDCLLESSELLGGFPAAAEPPARAGFWLAEACHTSEVIGTFCRADWAKLLPPRLWRLELEGHKIIQGTGLELMKSLACRSMMCAHVVDVLVSELLEELLIELNATCTEFECTSVAIAAFVTRRSGGSAAPVPIASGACGRALPCRPDRCSRQLTAASLSQHRQRLSVRLTQLASETRNSPIC